MQLDSSSCGNIYSKGADAIMYEYLVDELIRQTARKLLVESGDKAYIIE